jgi:hypothetical protein
LGEPGFPPRRRGGGEIFIVELMDLKMEDAEISQKGNKTK